MPRTVDDTAEKPVRKGGSWRRFVRRSVRWLLGLLLIPLLLVLIGVGLLYIPAVQDIVRGKAVVILTERTGAHVELDVLHLAFPASLRLEGLRVADDRGDTLLDAGLIKADLDVAALLDHRIALRHVRLLDVNAELRQYADSSFNFQHIVRAFASSTPADTTTGTGGGMAFSVDEVTLERIRFSMALAPSDLSLVVDLGLFSVGFDTFALDPMRFDANAIHVRLATVDLRVPPSTSGPSSYPELAHPLADLDVRFKRLFLEGSSLQVSTPGTPDSLWVGVVRASVLAKEMRSREQQAAFSKISLVRPRFGMVTGSYEATAEASNAPPPWLDRHDGFRYWTQDWDLAIDTLTIANGDIAFHTDSIIAPSRLLDPEHKTFDCIGLGARNLVVNNERMAVKLDSLAFNGGRQQERVMLAAQLEATAASLAVKDGRIEARNNRIDLHGTATPGDLSVAYRTPEAVPIDAEVAGDVRLADLLPLLRELGVDLPARAEADERWRTKLWLRGSMQDIRQAGIDLNGDQGSTVHAIGRIANAAQWPISNYAFTVDELTLGTGLRQVMKAFAPADVPLPMRLTLRADASGTGLDARVRMDLKSDLGDLSGKAEAHHWRNDLPGHIDVDLTATDIDAARLTGDTAIGDMSFILKLNGDGLNDASRQGTLAIIPTKLSYLGNDLAHLRLKADAAGDSLRTVLTSDAAAAAFALRTAGPWPRSGDSLTFAFDLAVERLHFQDLGLTPYELNMDGPLTGRIALMPDVRGRYTLQAPGLRVFNDARTFAFEHLSLNGLLDTDSTALELDCDAARIGYHANLSMDSTITLLRDRLLGAFQEPYAFRPPPGRHIDLKVDLPGSDRLVSLIHPALRAMEVKRFEGRYDSDRDSLELNLDVPLIDYAGVMVNGLRMDLKAAGARLDGELAVLRVMRDSLHVDDLVLQATNVPGALRTLLRMRDGAEDRYRIGVDLRREAGIPVVHLQEDLVLDRNTWRTTPDNALYLRPEGPQANDLVITNGAQRIALRTGIDGNHLDIAGFELSNITGLVRSADSLAVVHGTLDANVLLPFKSHERLKADVALHRLDVMDVPLGTVIATLEEDRADHYHGSFRLDGGTNRAQATLEAHLGATDTRVIVDGDLDLGDLSVFKPLVETHLFELGGALSGDLRYVQQGSSMQVLGRTVVTDGRFGLVRTGAVYRIPKDTVTFDASGLALHDLEVRDAKDNRFRLDGRINTGVDHEPALDLRLRTERFQLVNSTAKENPLFYGKLFGGIDLHIGGTATTPSVKGGVSVLDSTDLSVVLPGSKVEMIDHTGIVQFTTDLDAKDTLAVRSDSELLRDSLAAQLPGIDLDLRLKLDRNARFAIVLDPTTGDAATFRGEADLRFRYDPEGDIYLQGPFTVVDGGYTVEFYGLVKKRFDLVPGGTIIWDGDPLAGRMDMQAKYSTKVAPYPLVANARGGLTESERNALQAPLPFDVLIKIREAVQAPNISFGLDMDRQVRNSYPQVNSVLDQLAKPGNQEELNRQVFGLLVLSTFIENETNPDQGGSSLASTAARNSVNSILTQQLNRLTGQGIKGMDIQLGVSTYDQSQGGESYSRTTVDYKVTQRVLNDRVSIEAGGSFGYNERKQDVSAVSNTKAPQYAIAYDLTADGRLRLRVYHENAYDMYDGELVNNGVALMLTRDFEKNAKELERLRQELLKQRQAERNQEEKP